MLDCPGHTRKENSYDFDVPKVILRFYCQHPMTDRLYLMFVVSAFCCLFCFCSPRNHCWSGGP